MKFFIAGPEPQAQASAFKVEVYGELGILCKDFTF
jgi:hypothetical protein